MWLFFGAASILIFSNSALDVGGIVSGNRMASVPLGVSLGDGELDIEGICTKSGVACQNCTHAITCIELPVGWLKIPLSVCPDDETCNAEMGGCSSKSVPECDKEIQTYEHKCEQVGVFPDAFDCRKFHLCSPPEGYPCSRPADHRTAYCPRHYAYNPYTAQCSIKLPHGQCVSRPVPDCSQVGQTDVLAGSPNHYYVCLSKNGKIYPQIFICPHGLFFWDGFCRNEPKQAQKVETTKVTEADIAAAASTVKNDGGITNSPKPEVTSTAYRITEYPPDTFLADKFDLTNYETIDYTAVVPHSSYEFSSASVESF